MDRKKYNRELKAKIELDAMNGQKTIAWLSSKYGVRPIRSLFGRSSYLISLLMLLATEKIKMLRRGWASSFVSKGWPTANRSWLAKKQTGYLEWVFPRRLNALGISREYGLLQLPRSSSYSPRDCRIEDGRKLGFYKAYNRIVSETSVLWQSKDEGGESEP